MVTFWSSGDGTYATEQRTSSSWRRLIWVVGRLSREELQ